MDAEVRINIASLLTEFHIMVYRNKSLQAKLDNSGDLVIKGEDLGKFSKDLAIFLSRSIERIAEIE